MSKKYKGFKGSGMNKKQSKMTKSDKEQLKGIIYDYMKQKLPITDFYK